MKLTRLFLLVLCAAFLLLITSVPPSPSVRAQGGGPIITKGTPTPTPTPPAGPKQELPPQRSGNVPLAVPSNDDFNAALVIPSFPYQNSINTVQATVAADDPYMGCGSVTNSNTVWYRLTPTVSGLVEATTFSSNYDTVLAVYTGSRGALSRITCNDDASNTIQSAIYFEAVAGQTYYLEVADYGSPGGGQLIFNVNLYASSIANAFLRANMLTYDGQFVIGTTGGDPNTALDDNKRLLFGYPWGIGTSYSTLRLIAGGVTSDYRLGLDRLPTVTPSSDGTTLLSIWDIGGIHVEQRLSFVANPDTGRLDTTAIEYKLTNTSASPLQAGLRIMLDTMIGANDGGPFFVPTLGRITNEVDLYGVPDFWTVWESPTFDPNGLKAKGTLRGSGATTPNRLIMAHWDAALCPTAGAGLFSYAWDYQVNSNISITCDSALALYYNPYYLNPGQTRSVKTYYGLTSGDLLRLAPDINNFVNASRQSISNIASDSVDVSRVGDYFLDKQDEDEARREINGIFNLFGVITAGGTGVNWSRIGRGLNHIAEPGYEAALKASWNGWAKPGLAKRWSKPLYDALHNNRQLVLEKTALAGLEYYATERGKGVLEDEMKKWMLETFVPNPAPSNTPFFTYMGAPASQGGDDYRDELLREQSDLLARLPTLPFSTQEAAYRADMLARQQANEQIAAQLRNHRNLLWKLYQDRQQNENNWLEFGIRFILKEGTILGATLLYDGPGYYVASIGTSAIETIYDWVQDTRALEANQKMTEQSKHFLNSRVETAYQQIALNTLSGLYLIRTGMAPKIPTGTVSIGSMQSIGQYRFWPLPCWWAEESSQMQVNVGNSTPYSTAYLSSVAYNYSDFWKGPQRLQIEGARLTSRDMLRVQPSSNSSRKHGAGRVQLKVVK